MKPVSTMISWDMLWCPVWVELVTYLKWWRRHMSWLEGQMDNNKTKHQCALSSSAAIFFIIVFVYFLLYFRPFHFNTSITLVNLIYLHKSLEAFLHCSLRYIPGLRLIVLSRKFHEKYYHMQISLFVPKLKDSKFLDFSSSVHSKLQTTKCLII